MPPLILFLILSSPDTYMIIFLLSFYLSHPTTWVFFSLFSISDASFLYFLHALSFPSAGWANSFFFLHSRILLRLENINIIVQRIPSKEALLVWNMQTSSIMFSNRCLKIELIMKQVRHIAMSMKKPNACDIKATSNK